MQGLIDDSRAGRAIPPAAMWLLDNYPLLRSQARQLGGAVSEVLAEAGRGIGSAWDPSFGSEIVERDNGIRRSRTCGVSSKKRKKNSRSRWRNCGRSSRL